MNKRSCNNCAYSTRPVGRLYRMILWRYPGLLTCVNHPDAPGQIIGVPYTAVCANWRRRLPVRMRTEPPQPPDDKIRYIPLTQGKYAIVDAEDYEWLSQYKWHAVRDNNTFYARRTLGNGRHITMHRQIMQPAEGEVTDHMNGNGLDNRRANMRNCSRGENSQNRRKNSHTLSGYKGVWRDKKTGKYWAGIHKKHKGSHDGPFDTPIEAARAYDRLALTHFGPFARLNFPEEHEPPDHPA